MSYYTEHTQAYYFCRYILWYICIAPCLLEPSMTKHNSTLYLLLPASAFEKYLHLWMKYILILPIFCIILILGMKGVLTLSGTGYLSHFGNHMELYIIQKDQILTYSLLQGTFFIGCIAFKQQKLINSFVVLCSCLIAFFGIILSISLWEPADNSHGYWIANISYPIYNFAITSLVVALNLADNILISSISPSLIRAITVRPYTGGISRLHQTCEPQLAIATVDLPCLVHFQIFSLLF